LEKAFAWLRGLQYEMHGGGFAPCTRIHPTIQYF